MMKPPKIKTKSPSPETILKFGKANKCQVNMFEFGPIQHEALDGMRRWSRSAIKPGEKVLDSTKLIHMWSRMDNKGMAPCITPEDVREDSYDKNTKMFLSNDGVWGLVEDPEALKGLKLTRTRVADNQYYSPMPTHKQLRFTEKYYKDTYGGPTVQSGAYCYLWPTKKGEKKPWGSHITSCFDLPLIHNIKRILGDDIQIQVSKPRKRKQTSIDNRPTKTGQRKKKPITKVTVTYVPGPLLFVNPDGETIAIAPVMR